MAPPLKVFGFWRSQAMYRLRVAMKLKGIEYQEQPINLEAGEQLSDNFRKINPLGSIPAVLVDDASEPLTQSLAILEYFEETQPTPALLPSDPLGRARVRSLAAIAVSDHHPFIVPRVRKYLMEQAGFDATQWKAWQTQWLTAALRGFEARLVGSPSTGTFCHGDQPTIADICLAGLIQSTRTFKIEVNDIPTVRRIVERCEGLEAFDKSRAMYQSDFPKE